MTNSRSTKSALFTSVVAILLCCTMLLGTTFAWFTDTAQSSGNKIQAGTLDVDLLVLDNGTYTSVANSTEPIFNYTLWEPGYTQVETMKIANLGNLALKYQLNVIANEVQEGPNGANLAEVIDVYMAFGPQTPTKFADLSDTNVWWKCGTLKELMANPNGFTQGKLLPAGTDADAEGITLGGENGILVGDVTTTIALHMQETAGNEYQNLSLGNVDINLVATQWTYEADTFDNQYDKDATYPTYEYNPPVKAEVIESENPATVNGTPLDCQYQFIAPEDGDAAKANDLRWWHADFVVSVDKDIPEGVTVGLAGQYEAFSSNWLNFETDGGFPADKTFRLLYDYSTNSGEYPEDALYINYEELCALVKTFNCGAYAERDAEGKSMIAGTTLTVELRLYEVEDDDPADESGTKNIETGKYIMIGKYSHTFE